MRWVMRHCAWCNKGTAHVVRSIENMSCSECGAFVWDGPFDPRVLVLDLPLSWDVIGL